MSFLRYFSPIGAIRDLRHFLSLRRPHELWFMMLAMAITLVVLWMFVKDSHVPTPYKREIIYVKQWPITRSEAEIKAQQKIDLPKEQARKAEFERRLRKRQAEFKKYDDWLTNHGF